MRFELTLTALVVASAFVVGFSSVPVGDGPPRTTPNAAERPADQRLAQEQDRITGRNVTIQNVTLSNVTLTNVVVNRLVVDNVSAAEGERTVTLRNVSASTVQVRNASIRNLTFDTMGVNRSLSTALLGNVGTGVTPNDTLPSQPLEAQQLENRTVTGLEIGTLNVAGGAVANTTTQGRSPEVSLDAPAPELTGQGVTAEGMTVRNATVTGWSADVDGQNATQTES